MKGQETNLNSLIFLAIIITVVIAGMLTFTGNLATAYSKASNFTSINKSIELGNKISQSYELFKNEQNTETFWLGNALVTGAKVIWNFILIFISIPDSIGSLVNDFGAAISIPPIFLAAATVLIMFVGLVVIVKILTRS
jgi:hypothetical protein